ncbi:MAG: hypothetical protein HY927_11550 [Elusimicrobia bacterium]|nr:hypothetical protein [Elusimicrobiota bacterium]
MAKTSPESRLIENTRSAGKTYSFDDRHDPAEPAEHWFQETPEGEALFLVLYTRACLWSLCLGCNLPSRMSRRHIPFDMIMRQIDRVFDGLIPPGRLAGLRKIILSNNGSVLDERTLSTTALLYFVAKMNMRCPRLKVLAMETRAEHIDEVELEVLARALGEGPVKTGLELAMGFEAYDDRLRNAVFRKGLSKAHFERAVRIASRHGFGVKAYFMLKPAPGMSEDEAVRDIERGIEYLDRLARRHGAVINMHLNATYAARGTPLETALRSGRFVPPRLDSLRRAALAARGKRVSLYLGLYDEGLAAPGGSFIRPGDGPLLRRLRAFNKTRDFRLLKPSHQGGRPA